MEWVRGSAELRRKLRRPVLTIGNFDGLHVGHQAIMRTVVERARVVDGEAVVFTFDPHPRKVVNPDNPPRLLTTLDQKLELLEELGVDVTIVEPFDRAFASTPPELFIRKTIHELLRPESVYVGYDFHFGRDREGSMRLLTELGPRLGFSVTIIPEVTVGELDVNSTRIRDLLERGEVETAATLLGRAFSVRGTVQRGQRRGRSIGFPTANIVPENEVLPRNGVYAGWIRLLDEGEPPAQSRHAVVTNIGMRPTFEDEQGLLAEAHLLDFAGDLYGRRIELAFDAALRPERKFAGVEELKAQIARDAEAAREVALRRSRPRGRAERGEA